MKTRTGNCLRALLFSAAAFLVLPLSVSQARTDFNLIGRNVSILSQNMHFERKMHDDQLSERFFNTYLQRVDPDRLYFTREEIDELRGRIGTRLNDFLLRDRTVEAATMLYDFYRENASERLTMALNLLDEHQFDFAASDSMPYPRSKADWPADERALRETWLQWLKYRLLEEKLKNSGDGSDEADSASRLKSLYARMLDELNQPVDEEKKVNLLLAVVVNSLDPHSEYMGVETGKRFRDELGASLVGIGIRFYADQDGTMTIGGIIPGGPAAKSGQIRTNDKIVGIDSMNTGEMVDVTLLGADKASDLIRGMEGTRLRLKVKEGTEGGQYRIVELTRARVELKDSLAKGEIIEMPGLDGTRSRIGVLTLPSFYVDMDGGERSCAEDVRRILERMVAEGTEGLVLDLRGNPGGALDEAVKMAGFFTGKGPQVQVKDSLGVVSCLSSTEERPLYGGKVVVLMDKSSASASEILAASLQDYGRALIVGDSSSFGKGTVQEVIPIGRFLPYFADASSAGLLKLTTQKYYRVEGGSTQFKGVESDIVIPSLVSAFDIGEDKLDYALPHDSVAPARGYRRDLSLNRLLPKLKARSAERLAKDAEFQLVLDGIERIRKRRAESRISLNGEEREREYRLEQERKKKIADERRKYVAALLRPEEQGMKVYRLTLEDVDKPELVLSRNDVPSVTGRDDELLQYPHGLDPVLRESLHIMNDMMEATGGRRELTVSPPLSKDAVAGTFKEAS